MGMHVCEETIDDEFSARDIVIQCASTLPLGFALASFSGSPLLRRDRPFFAQCGIRYCISQCKICLDNIWVCKQAWLDSFEVIFAL